MQINDLKEYNCLMRHAIKEEADAWYWTDGNDVANSGVWTHASDNTEVSFFPPKVRCACTDNQISCGGYGNAYLLYIGSDLQYRGNYCDNNASSKQHNFICEAQI